jgi:hypothetical protein
MWCVVLGQYITVEVLSPNDAICGPVQENHCGQLVSQAGKMRRVKLWGIMSKVNISGVLRVRVGGQPLVIRHSVSGISAALSLEPWCPISSCELGKTQPHDGEATSEPPQKISER